MALALALSISGSAWAQDNILSSETDNEIQSLKDTARFIMSCENGEFPDDAVSVCEKLMGIDPELAVEVLDYMESTAIPIETVTENLPDTIGTYSDKSDSPDKQGMYVRDDDGGHFVYLDEDDLIEETLSDEIVENVESGIDPLNYDDYDAITDPRYNAHCNSVCKVYAKRGGTLYHGSGFYVSNTVVATAGHVLWNIFWNNVYNPGWADEVYIKQAYAPSSSSSKEPYGIVFVDNKQMTVGASWKTDHTDDDDWGAFVVKGRLGGYTYRPKRQISVDSYIGNSITTYGYPQPDFSRDYSMFRVKGKAVARPSDRSTYRVLYGSDTSGGSADGWHGMSGGPVLDNNGNVIAIFIGCTDAALTRSKAVSLDKWLYAALKKYE